jgi:hypothetical protein
LAQVGFGCRLIRSRNIGLPRRTAARHVAISVSCPIETYATQQRRPLVGGGKKRLAVFPDWPRSRHGLKYKPTSRLGLNEDNLFRLDSLADDHASESPRHCYRRLARRRRVARGCGTRPLQARSAGGAAVRLQQRRCAGRPRHRVADQKFALAWRDPDKDPGEVTEDELLLIRLADGVMPAKTDTDYFRSPCNR